MGESASRIRCPGCAKTYRWREELAGRKVRCKACGGVLLMPAEPPQPAGNQRPQRPAAPPRTPSEPIEVKAPADRCPSCGSQIKVGAVICVNCGFNLKDGKHLETRIEASSDDMLDGKKSKKKEKAGKKGKLADDDPSATDRKSGKGGFWSRFSLRSKRK